ncbi:hypothetical protein BC936DRAFT_141001 [Jimgerdemannia flammicorona]|uniref:C2H2-type domain-containing protein n=1 Tax=Jimgerdemannia flammicorona TaxID=994334 RepID=A0A433A326_9FUNG|nr:hypothetical protein BC936DRAFT_141001 [Jimgerdemannia flammicorona]
MSNYHHSLASQNLQTVPLANLKSALSALTPQTSVSRDSPAPQPATTTAPPSPDSNPRTHHHPEKISKPPPAAPPSPKETDRNSMDLLFKAAAQTIVSPSSESKNGSPPQLLPTPSSPSVPIAISHVAPPPDQSNGRSNGNNNSRYLPPPPIAYQAGRSPSSGAPHSSTSSEIRFEDPKRKSWETPKSGSSSPEVAYKCTECGAPFRRSHDMKRHMKSHSGERPYVCTVCDRPFARLDALHRHQRAEGGAACKAVHSQRTIPPQASPRQKMPRPPGSAKLSPLERNDLPSPAAASPLSQTQNHATSHPDQRHHEDSKSNGGFRTQQIPPSAPQRQNSEGKPHIPTLIIPFRASQPYPNEAPYTPTPPINMNSAYSSRNGGENMLSASAPYPMHSAGSSHHAQEQRGRESSETDGSDDEVNESASGPARPILPYPQSHHPMTSYREQQLAERNQFLEERVRELELKLSHDRKNKRRTEMMEERVHLLEIQNETLRSLIIEGRAYGNYKRRRVSYSDEEDELEKSPVSSATGFHPEHERDTERR